MASCVARRLVLKTLSRLSVKHMRVNVKCSINRGIHVSSVSLRKYFSDKHEWLDVPDGSTSGTVGITDYAQDKLGEVVYVQMPEVGDTVECDGEAGVLESVKAASDVYSPVSGEITKINDNLVDDPALINKSAFEEGWLFKMTISNPEELKTLMDENGYKVFLETLE